MSLALFASICVWLRDFWAEFRQSNGLPNKVALREVLLRRNGIACNLGDEPPNIQQAGSYLQRQPPAILAAAVDGSLADL